MQHVESLQEKYDQHSILLNKSLYDARERMEVNPGILRGAFFEIYTLNIPKSSLNVSGQHYTFIFHK